MKNIHVLPTDKPSRLVRNSKNLLKLCIQTLPLDRELNCFPQNIYITSDEKLPYNDSIFDTGAFYHKDASGAAHIITKNTFKPNPNFCKRIILTTDPDLIKDGVQSIEDEFLEWFVKNANESRVPFDVCKVKRGYLGMDGFVKTNQPLSKDKIQYKIIIPKEEPKPHSFCETPEEKCTMNHCDENGCQNRKRELVEPKDETLEEAAGTYYPSGDVWTEEEAVIRRLAFKNGVKWQAERMYSEEDIKNAFDSAREFNSLDGIVDVHIVLPMGGDMSDLQPLYPTFNEWFEQFKKK